MAYIKLCFDIQEDKMKSKSILIFYIVLNVLFSSIFVFANPQETSPIANEEQIADEIPIDAKAYVLADLKTGKVLKSKNENDKMYPASITKIMTAILALENLTDFSEVVVATEEAISPITMKHSHMGILTGEELTVENLLYGMLVYSANDAANVLAVRIGGSLENFVLMMNQKATELGATNTNYKNPHGFHDDQHYTTAHDVAIIAQYAMKNETFRKIVSTDMYTIEPTNKYKETRYLSSTNHLMSRRRMLDYYYGKTIGIKTGFTDEAGSCLAAAAKNGDTEILTVVLNCPNTYGEDGQNAFVQTRRLFDYAFDNFEYTTIAANGDVVSDSGVYEAKDNVRVALTPKYDISSMLRKDIDKKQITSNKVLNEKIAAPIKKGDVLGTIEYSYQGEVLGNAELIAVNDVKKDYIIATIHLIGKILFNPIFIIAVILIVYIVISSKIRRDKRRRKRRSRMKYVK